MDKNNSLIVFQDVKNSKNSDVPKTTLRVFEHKRIRRTWFKDEWFYSVIDVVRVLTDSANARDYWYKMKIRLGEEEKAELSTICLQLKMPAEDGKLRETDCADKEGIFRIIQSNNAS